LLKTEPEIEREEQALDFTIPNDLISEEYGC